LGNVRGSGTHDFGRKSVGNIVVTAEAAKSRDIGAVIAGIAERERESVRRVIADSLHTV